MKIVFEEFDTWRKKHFEYVKQNGKIMRFGQAFCNQFDIQNSDLFYMESDLRAEAYICENYLAF